MFTVLQTIYLNELKLSLPTILNDCDEFVKICSELPNDNFINTIEKFIKICSRLNNALKLIVSTKEKTLFSVLLQYREENKNCSISHSTIDNINNSENFISELIKSCISLFQIIENINIMSLYNISNDLPETLTIAHRIKHILDMLLNSNDSTFNSFMLKVND